LVVGAGDGGLTDVLRLRIENFDHKTLHESVGAALNEQLLSKSTQIDRQRSKITDKYERQQKLYWDYKEHVIPGRCIDVSKLKFRLRSDTYVVLRGDGPYPYDTTTSILNRVAIFLLIEVLPDKCLTYIAEPIRPEHVRRDQWFAITSSGKEMIFHDVIVRVGTERAVTKFLGNDVVTQPGFDDTRFPQWSKSEPTYFSQKWKPLDRFVGRPFDRELPAIPTVIGRAREIADLIHLLETAGKRLLTLIGPVGQGKSGLALAVATGLRQRFEGDIIYVDLRSLNCSGQFENDRVSRRYLLAEKIARRLGVPPPPKEAKVNREWRDRMERTAEKTGRTV
jgi:hypothetical protein